MLKNEAEILPKKIKKKKKLTIKFTTIKNTKITDLFYKKEKVGGLNKDEVFLGGDHLHENKGGPRFNEYKSSTEFSKIKRKKKKTQI